MKKIEVLGLQTIPEIEQGDNLAEIIVHCAANEIGGLQDRDIAVLTSKIFAWLQNFRRLVVRYEYHLESFLAMIQLGCIVILLRRVLG